MGVVSPYSRTGHCVNLFLRVFNSYFFIYFIFTQSYYNLLVFACFYCLMLSSIKIKSKFPTIILMNSFSHYHPCYLKPAKFSIPHTHHLLFKGSFQSGKNGRRQYIGHQNSNWINQVMYNFK